MKSLKTQHETLEALFSKTPKKAVKPETLEVLIPKWQEIASIYGEAVEKMIANVKCSRPAFDYREGQWAKQVRETERKKEMFAKLPDFTEDPRFKVLTVQMGEKYKGRSVEDVRKSYDSNEFGLGIFEVGAILLTHPEILSKYEDLWIDCPGDEFDDSNDAVRFDHAPIVSFRGGGVRFGADGVSSVGVSYGSASGFSPQ